LDVLAAPIVHTEQIRYPHPFNMFQPFDDFTLATSYCTLICRLAQSNSAAMGLLWVGSNVS
jgi:hypothetical protein